MLNIFASRIESTEMQFTRRVFKSICAIMLIVIVVLLIPPLATQILNAIILPRNLFLTIHGSKCWRSCFMGTSLNTCTFAGKHVFLTNTQRLNTYKVLKLHSVLQWVTQKKTKIASKNENCSKKINSRCDSNLNHFSLC